MDKNEALKDFMQRIEHYKEEYESLDYAHDKDISFIQIFNQGERFIVNKLAGEERKPDFVYLNLESHVRLHSLMTVGVKV